MPDPVYPQELEETFTLDTGRQVLLRPIRPDDEPDHYEFLSRLTREDIRRRFFGTIKTLSHEQMEQFTRIDYDRQMAFIASGETADGIHETLGVVRTVTDGEGRSAEFAIVIRSDIKHHGLGHKLMDKAIAYCRSRGIAHLTGEVLADNRPMIEMVRVLGFQTHMNLGEGTVEVSLDLQW